MCNLSSLKKVNLKWYDDSSKNMQQNKEKYNFFHASEKKMLRIIPESNIL